MIVDSGLVFWGHPVYLTDCRLPTPTLLTPYSDLMEPGTL